MAAAGTGPKASRRKTTPRITCAFAKVILEWVEPCATCKSTTSSFSTTCCGNSKSAADSPSTRTRREDGRAHAVNNLLVSRADCGKHAGKFRPRGVSLARHKVVRAQPDAPRHIDDLVLLEVKP